MEYLINLGYLGLFIGSFLASTVLLFSSDILLAAMLLAGGNPIICLFVATFGNWLGGLTSYLLGYLGKWKWLEKYFKVSREKLEKQKSKIDKFGVFLAFFAWLPFVGDIFSIALGFYKVKPKTCAAFMLIGRFLRFLVWIILYHFYGEDFVKIITVTLK